VYCYRAEKKLIIIIVCCGYCVLPERGCCTGEESASAIAMSQTSTPKTGKKANEPRIELDDDDLSSLDQDATLTDREAEAIEKSIFLSDSEDKGATNIPSTSQDTRGNNCEAKKKIGTKLVLDLSKQLGQLGVNVNSPTKSARRRRTRRQRFAAEKSAELNQTIEETNDNGKRPRDVGEASGSKPPKRFDFAPKKSYSEAVKDSLQIVIVKQDQENETVKMTFEEVESVKDFLMEKLDEGTSSGVRPCFTGVRSFIGNLEVSCADSMTVEWVKSRVGEMGNLKLCVKTKDEIPILKPISLFLSGKTIEITTIFKRLTTQNEGLSTKYWRVFHKGVPGPKGLFLVVGVDEISLNYIKAHNNELYYGFHRISVGLRPTEAQQQQ
jgi:Domain of unknown function (DUF4780)